MSLTHHKQIHEIWPGLGKRSKIPFHFLPPTPVHLAFTKDMEGKLLAFYFPKRIHISCTYQNVLSPKGNAHFRRSGNRRIVHFLFFVRFFRPHTPSVLKKKHPQTQRRKCGPKSRSQSYLRLIWFPRPLRFFSLQIPRMLRKSQIRNKR